LVVICALCAGSCIVTDKIEFEDYINNPPELIWVQPINTEVSEICKVKQEFNVRVWDPDEGDLASYAAKLKMYVTANPQIRECSVGEYFAPGAQVEKYETGVQISVDCEIDLEPYQGLEEGTLIPFEVQVSDLGYDQSVLADGARAAEVVWVRKINLDEVCESQ
jgi:hypothetical protein